MTLRQLQRLRDLYQWDNCLHLSRRGKPSNYKVKVTQTNGLPGWLCLTRDENGDPITLLVQRRENPKVIRIRCVLDERCYEDSILRVEYTSTSICLADVWMWNACNLFKTTTFSWRQEFLHGIYNHLYTSCPLFETHSIVLRSSVTGLRGHEYYLDRVGEFGIFVEYNEEADGIFDIFATDIPDVYKLSNGGYLRVRTLTLSKYLRTLGKTFKLKCQQNEDGTWSPVEISQHYTNGTS